MEARLQGDAATADGDTEVRRVSSAVHHDVFERSGVLSRRRQDSTDALDGSQIGITERVCSADRGLAWIVGLPWTERTRGNDVTHGLRIGEIGSEMQGLIRSDAGHFQTCDIKF